MMLNTHKQITQIKINSESFIRPKFDVQPPNQPHYLGPVGILFLSLDQIQKGLLFPTKPKNFQQFLEKLKNSLAFSLVDYYPLAGQFVTQKFHDEHAIWVYVDCNKGLGARLIHSSADNLVCSDLISSVDVHPDIRLFFDLGEKSVNHDGHTKSLLSIQVTELKDGVVIGFTINHSIADGTSLSNFISSLSQIFLQLDDNKNNGPNENFIPQISNKPICKTFFPDGYGPIIKLPYIEPNEFITHNVDVGPLRERIFHFSPISMSNLKAKANQECGPAHNKISSFQALSAFLWISITRARNSDPDEDTDCALITNLRSKINPPLSENYFGCFIRRLQGSCKVKELLGNGLGFGATLINKLVMGLNDKEGRAFLKRVMDSPFVVQPNTGNVYYKPNCVSIGGSARFDMYGPEFGFGKAVAALGGYANKEDGKVTANPGREGNGSVDLEVCLRPEIMSALELDEEFMSFVSVV